MNLAKILRLTAAAVVVGTGVLAVQAPVVSASIYESGYTTKIKMTASQRAKVRRISRSANVRISKIFRKYGISPTAQPEMNKLMQASGELQSVARAERNALAAVLTPTQLQEYDKLMRQTEDRIVRAAK
jgi:ABC-type Fe2+-enterobactin transport system substrate-binding protein